MTFSGRSKSNQCGNNEFDFGAGGRTAEHFQDCADAFGAFAHTGKAPVAVTAETQDLGVKTDAVVANENAQAEVSVFELDFDFLGEALMTPCSKVP